MKINEKITSINKLLTKFQEKVLKIKDNKMKEEIQNYNSYYKNY